MNNYVVDTDCIRKSIEDLKKIKQTCIENEKKKPPKNTKDQGGTNNEVKELCENLKQNWVALETLIDKTLEFLGSESERIDATDKADKRKIVNK